MFDGHEELCITCRDQCYIYIVVRRVRSLVTSHCSLWLHGLPTRGTCSLDVESMQPILKCYYCNISTTIACRCIATHLACLTASMIRHSDFFASPSTKFTSDMLHRASTKPWWLPRSTAYNNNGDNNKLVMIHII